MVGYKRGPICGETNPSFAQTPGPTGINDAADPQNTLLIADRRSPVGSSSASPAVASYRTRFKFGQLAPAYTGPPYVLGKPEIASRLIMAFLAVARSTHKSKSAILTALTKLANQEIQRLGIPLPTLPPAPPGNPLAAGGFTCGNDQKGHPQGIWEIKLSPEDMDLTPYKNPKAFAAQCGTVAHEYEHLVDTYYAVRFAVASGEKDASIAKEMAIPSKIIAIARSKPLKRGSTEYRQAEEFYWFSYFTRLDRKRLDPIKELSRLSLVYLNKHRTIKQLKRYNATDRISLDIEFKENLTQEERAALIKKLEAEMLTVKKRVAEARKRYTALPKETVGHVVEEIFKSGVLKGLSRLGRP